MQVHTFVAAGGYEGILVAASSFLLAIVGALVAEKDPECIFSLSPVAGAGSMAGQRAVVVGAAIFWACAAGLTIEDVPSTGAFSVRTLGGGVRIYSVIGHISEPTFCTEYTISGIGSSAAETFYLLPKLYNARLAWSSPNGRSLSFVNNQGHGTWLVGDTPGVDSGVAYSRGEMPALVPPVNDVSSYKVFSGGAWVSASANGFRIECTGGQSVAGAGFLWAQTVAGESVFVALQGADADENACEREKSMRDGLGAAQSLLLPPACAPAVYSVNKATWTPLKDDLVSAMWLGSALQLSSEPDSVYVPVSMEDMGTGFRTTAINPTDGREIFPVFTKRGRLTLPRQYNEAVYDSISTGAKPTLTPVPPSQAAADARLNGVHVFETLQVGQWVWVFSRFAPGYREPKGLLMRVQARSRRRLALEWHSTDRGRVLHRARVDGTVGRAVAQVFEDENRVDLAFFERDAETNEEKRVDLEITAALPLNASATMHLKHYIERHEGLFQTSSCFFYHSAVAIPEPLVYAAEIVCVLMGYKPVAMVQYTSPSDDQTVYPLVRQLCDHIVALGELLGDAFPVRWRVFKFLEKATGLVHESLILYRSNRKNLVDALIPRGDVAQALHILPFLAGAENRTRVLEEQIYNSYWNGMVLGYPPNMVEAYITSFHSDLVYASRIEQLRRSQRDFEAFKAEQNFETVQIGKGLDVPVDDFFWESFRAAYGPALAQQEQQQCET